MKLHNETVSPRLIRCLKTIMQSDIFKDFNLVGGTCLSLQLGHRRSIDIDLFTAIDYGSMNTTAMKALELIKTKPEIRQKLWNNTNYLRKELTKRGFDIGKSVSPIFPIMVRDNKKVYQIAKMLQERGIFTIAIVYPAVRTKEARLRVSVLSTHEKEHLDSLVNALEEINKIIPIK